MLSEFITTQRAEIIARCRARVAARMAPRASASAPELEHGIPMFLDQLADSLRTKLGGEPHPSDTTTATRHGRERLAAGFTVSQVVQDYGDVCQTIMDIAIERGAAFSVAEFRALNAALDEAIADAVAEYARQRELTLVAEGTERALEDLGVFSHEIRNLLATATLAYAALQSGGVGINGNTGAVLGRSLAGLSHLVTRTLAVVRLEAGIDAPQRVAVAELLEEIEVGSLLEARARGLQLTIEVVDRTAVVMADRQILASVVTNLVQNALKFTRRESHVVLRCRATADLVQIEVEDECGGLPKGAAESLFAPFLQRAPNRSGLGLGLAICARGAKALGGTLRIRDLPGTGCVFTVELRRAPAECAPRTTSFAS